jgi:hypothetical protein
LIDVALVVNAIEHPYFRYRLSLIHDAGKMREAGRAIILEQFTFHSMQLPDVIAELRGILAPEKVPGLDRYHPRFFQHWITLATC